MKTKKADNSDSLPHLKIIDAFPHTHTTLAYELPTCKYPARVYRPIALLAVVTRFSPQPAVAAAL